MTIFFCLSSSSCFFPTSSSIQKPIKFIVWSRCLCMRLFYSIVKLPLCHSLIFIFDLLLSKISTLRTILFFLLALEMIEMTFDVCVRNESKIVLDLCVLCECGIFNLTHMYTQLMDVAFSSLCLFFFLLFGSGDWSFFVSDNYGS